MFIPGEDLGLLASWGRSQGDHPAKLRSVSRVRMREKHFSETISLIDSTLSRFPYFCEGKGGGEAGGRQRERPWRVQELVEPVEVE